MPTDRNLPRPISESYWVEPGRFLAGEYPGHFDDGQVLKRIDSLLEAGFDTFIDLTEEGEIYPYQEILNEQSQAYGLNVQYFRFPIGDFGLPSTELMRAILDKISESLENGRKIYLHCCAGIGRTGTTVGCYLVRHGSSGAAALRQLDEWWREVPKSQFHPHTPETREQAAFVREWTKHENPPNGGRTIV